MGGVISNPVDDETQNEIEELMKTILTTFTISYTKATVVGIVKEEKKAFRKTPASFKLNKRSKEYVDDTPKKTGWLTKQGGSIKTMKRRFFVVKSDWSIEYYEKEEDAGKGKKPKGEMSLAGYTVNEEPNQGIIERKRRLAEQMGVDLSELSKPKEWPQETIEIHHPSRRTWYVVCETMDDKNAWISQFKSCCRNAHGLKNRDKVHEYAFAEAIRETRIALGHWDSYSWGGSESDVLADLIAEEIDNTIMSRIYAKISGPTIIRSKIRKAVVKAMNSAISTASSTAWTACDKAIAEVRAKVDPIIRNNISVILEKEEAITSKIKEGALSIINPVLKEHVTPHLAKIAGICKAPVTAAFDKAIELFIQEASKLNVSGSTKDEVKRSIYGLNYFTWWSISPALDKLDVMLEALQALQGIFPDMSAYSLIWDMREKLRARVDAACFSFEDRLLASIDVNPDLLRNNQALVATANKIRTGIVEDLRHDAKIAARQFWIKLMKAIVMPPFEKLVIPACKDLVDPLVSLIPEQLKEIIDPLAVLDQVLNDIINASIVTVVGQ